MKLNNYYYHTILKDALSKEELYENLEIILKDGYIKSRSLLENKKENSKERYIRSFKELSDTYNRRQGKILPREAIFDDLRHNKDILNKYLSDFVEGINRINKEIKIKKICIGGGFSLHKRHFFRTLHEDLPKHEIFIAKNFSDAGILGAVNLPIKRF